MKKCIKCQAEMPADAYPFHVRRLNKRRNVCRECLLRMHRRYDRERYVREQAWLRAF